MMPRLSAKYDHKFEITSKPQADYQTDEYFTLDLPVAPGIMAVEDIVVEGSDITEDKLETVICRHLGLPEPELPKTGFFKRLFGR